jgi:hypothetical protein
MSVPARVAAGVLQSQIGEDVEFLERFLREARRGAAEPPQTWFRTTAGGSVAAG